MAKHPYTILDKERLVLRDLATDHKAIDDAARIFGRESDMVIQAMQRYHQRVQFFIKMHPKTTGLDGEELKKEFLKKFC